MYAVTTINSSTVLLHMGSIAEIRRWAEANNLVLGKPQKHVATYSVEREDGSQLTDDERASLQPEDSETLYMQRQVKDWSAILGRPVEQDSPLIATLYQGAAQAAIQKKNTAQIKAGKPGFLK
jgi:hypothetical protein